MLTASPIRSMATTPRQMLRNATTIGSRGGPGSAQIGGVTEGRQQHQSRPAAPEQNRFMGH